MRTLLLCLTLAALTGCSLAPSDKVIQAFAQSERSWCFAGTSVYGSIRMGGSGLTGGTMTCTQEGLSLSAGGTQVQIPVNVQIAPAVQVAPTK